ncbi:hypothetical protein BDR06DRAFT_1015233 [Suillus hirtellus]|nr:hypothetical protein BDR06DRAFT_1015233 [Suillus hirtellus]
MSRPCNVGDSMPLYTSVFSWGDPVQSTTATNMNYHGHHQQNTKIPQVEADPEPVAPTPALLPPAAPTPVPVIPAAAATTTAAAAIATALHRPRR